MSATVRALAFPLLSLEELDLWRDEVKAHYDSGFTALGDLLKRRLRAYESATAQLVECATVAGEDEGGRQAHYAVRAVSDLRRDYDECLEELPA